MYLKYSRHTILVMEPILPVASILGIAPVYDFHCKKLISPKLYRFYSGFLLLGYVIGICITTYGRSDTFGDSLNASPVIFLLDMLTDVNMYLLHINSLLGSILKIEDWENLFNRLGQLENKRNLRTRGAVEKSFSKNAAFHSWMTILFTGCVIASFIWLVTLDRALINGAIGYYSFMTDMIVAITINNIVLTLKCKFQDMTKLLYQSTKLPESKMVETIDNIRRMYVTMVEIVEIFNHIFGWTNLFMLFESSAVLVLSLANINEPVVLNPEAGEYVSLCYSVFYVTSTSLILMASISIPICCDTVIVASQNMLLTSLDVRENCAATSEEYQALSKLAKLMTKKKIRFSAGNFFQLNRATVSALISNTATYLIVVYQMK